MASRDLRAWIAQLEAESELKRVKAKVDRELHPVRAEWGNKRFPPKCHNSRPETVELVERRWKEYGL